MTRKMTKMKFAKTDTRYWERKVGFQTPASRTFSVQIQHANRRMIIGLGTANRAQAAFEARQLYVALKANGWDETMRRRRGDPMEKKCDVTIGEYLEAIREKSLLRPETIESYAVALRMIAGAISGRESKAHRDAIKLRLITDDKVEAWRASYIKRKAVNPLAEKSARITASSLILRAKALFIADTVARIRDVVEVPDPLPFASVKAESVPPPRYRSTFDIVALVESAKEELATERPELFKIFLLGAMAGLRRHEIDLLQWRAFLFDEGAIRIETTEHFRPKSHLRARATSRSMPSFSMSFAASGRGRRVIPTSSSRAMVTLPPLWRALMTITAATASSSRFASGFAPTASSQASHSTRCARNSARKSTPATGSLPRARRCVMAACP